MKKLRQIITFLFLFIFPFGLVFAHPLDISSTYLSFKNSWKIDMTTYFHSYEISYLLKEHGVENTENIESYFENEDIIKNYVVENTLVKNNWSKCQLLDDIEVIRDQSYDILSDGLRVNYHFVCPSEKIENLFVELSYFSEFQLQTNKITVSKLLDNLYYKVLTPKVTSFELDVNNITHDMLDSDGDWLSDEDEKIYQTDPENIDTDWDEFDDKEEIDNWRNPLNPDFSPGQDLEPKREEGFLAKVYADTSKNSGKWLNDNSQYFGGEFLKEVLASISDFLNSWETGFFKVFFLVVILWIIHAIWPGHSKSLLVSYVLERDKKFRDGIMYSAIFSVIHILDILVLFALYKLSANFIDYSNLTSNIRFYSWIILILLWLYLFYTRVYKAKKECESHGNSIWTAVVAGLMPCSFGWSIFILLVSIGQTGWIFPLVLALGLWIFLTLATISVLAIFLKDRLYDKIEALSNYWLILSILIIMSVWVLMLF